MDQRPRGRTLPVGPGRRLVLEIMHQARNVPLVTITREFSIPAVVAARLETGSRISWIALFAKAYALAARRHPHLRRNWITFPWARIYEHPVSECIVPVEREWQGDDLLLYGKVYGPENMSLADLDGYVRRFQNEPVWSVSAFRQLLRIARYPTLLRRFLFWSTLNWSGFKRCKRFGTFVVTSLGNFGCMIAVPRMPLTAYLVFGPIAHDGRVEVGLTFDHRVMDGRHAARALEDVERILNTALLGELRKAEPADRTTRGPATWSEEEYAVAGR
jgi:2-oxoacid dehydrogenases acyltransferase (catalytic domain)